MSSPVSMHSPAAYTPSASQDLAAREREVVSKLKVVTAPAAAEAHVAIREAALSALELLHDKPFGEQVSFLHFTKPLEARRIPVDAGMRENIAAEMNRLLEPIGAQAKVVEVVFPASGHLPETTFYSMKLSPADQFEA